MSILQSAYKKLALESPLILNGMWDFLHWTDNTCLHVWMYACMHARTHTHTQRNEIYLTIIQHFLVSNTYLFVSNWWFLWLRITETDKKCGVLWLVVVLAGAFPLRSCYEKKQGVNGENMEMTLSWRYDSDIFYYSCWQALMYDTHVRAINSGDVLRQ